MEDLKELDELLDPVLLIPYKGKEYRVEALDAETGLRFQKLLRVGVQAAQDEDIDPADIELIAKDEELDFFRTTLGPVYDEMIADKLSFPALKLAAETVFLWTVQGFDMAKEYWASRGKARPQNRAQRRAKTTPTGAANTTREPGSGTGTKTRQAKPKAKGTPGTRS